jgi:hypothetical protein
MRREQELEIEKRRLEWQLAAFQRDLALICRIVSNGMMHGQIGLPLGRRWGQTKIDEMVFAKTLFETFHKLPPDQRSKGGVARELRISRRTLHRYLERWQIPWPPVDMDTT